MLDEGTDWFQPSNLEITDIEVGNPAHNVIPAAARARISIRFNDLHTGAELGERVTEIAARHGATARPVVSGESYLTPPGELSDIVAAAIEAETGITPELSTSGGTSDARFLKDLCPVIDFGPPNATMHKRDEAVALDDLEALARIYRRIALAALTGEQPMSTDADRDRQGGRPDRPRQAAMAHPDRVRARARRRAARPILSRRDAAWVETVVTYVTGPIGQIFLRLLFMLVIPLLFAALVVGIAEMGEIRALKTIGLRTLAYTVIVSGDRGRDLARRGQPAPARRRRRSRTRRASCSPQGGEGAASIVAASAESEAGRRRGDRASCPTTSSPR